MIFPNLIDMVVDRPQVRQIQQTDGLQTKGKERIVFDLQIVPDHLLPWIVTVLHLHLTPKLLLIHIIEALLDDLNQI